MNGFRCILRLICYVFIPAQDNMARYKRGDNRIPVAPLSIFLKKS